MTETGDDEARAAERLARALDEVDGSGMDPGVDDPEADELLRLAGRVRATAGLEKPLDPERREAIIEEALGRMRSRRGRALYWVAGALAAAFVLFVVGFLFSMMPQDRTTGPRTAFAAPTDGLFDGPFPEEQSSSERMDRIVQARTRGYFDALIMERSEATSAAVERGARGVEVGGLAQVEAELGRMSPW